MIQDCKPGRVPPVPTGLSSTSGEVPGHTARLRARCDATVEPASRRPGRRSEGLASDDFPVTGQIAQHYRHSRREGDVASDTVPTSSARAEGAGSDPVSTVALSGPDPSGVRVVGRPRRPFQAWVARCLVPERKSTVAVAGGGGQSNGVWRIDSALGIPEPGTSGMPIGSAPPKVLRRGEPDPLVQTPLWIVHVLDVKAKLDCDVVEKANSRHPPPWFLML
jgi:hypothetical protein